MPHHLPIFIKFKGLYIPTNLSDNNLRHFGFKSHKILFLQIQELLYLNSKDLHSSYSVEIRAYFELKNNGYNVLPTKLEFNNFENENFNNENFLINFNILDFKDLNCSKVLKKFTKEEILEIKKMENKINEFKKENEEKNENRNGKNKNEDKNKNNFLIYKKTKNFKRSDTPLGELRFIKKFEKVKDVLKENNDFKMICLLSEDDFIFLDVEKLEKLSFGLDPRLRKKGKI